MQGRIRLACRRLREAWGWHVSTGRVIPLPNACWTFDDARIAAKEMWEDHLPDLRSDMAAWLDQHLSGRWRIIRHTGTDVSKIGGIAVKTSEDEVLFRLAWSEQLVERRT